MRNSNQILHEGRTILEENFYKIDHAICPGQKFLCQECWRAIDLFAIANLPVQTISDQLCCML